MQCGVAVISKVLIKLIKLSIAFFIGLFIGTALLLRYESTSNKPWSWDSPPIIANCYGDDFNNLYVVRGVDYWVLRNEEIAFIIDKPPNSVCKHDFLDGFIILKKGVMKNDSTLAYTKRKIRLGSIRASTIYFSPGSFKLELLVEHELGHAFGYQHTDKKGHIMHPEYENMGKDSEY